MEVFAIPLGLGGGYSRNAGSELFHVERIYWTRTMLWNDHNYILNSFL